VVDFDDSAEVYVINTCSVTHLGERKSRQMIRRAVRSGSKATIVVTGCYAQLSPGELEAIEGVDVIVGTQDRYRIVDIVESAATGEGIIKAVDNIMTAGRFEDIPLFSFPGRTRAFLKIQEGCTNFCTYCIVPYARGPLRSRPMASVVQEAEKLVAAGFKEIVLAGIHLGAYGRDTAVQPANLTEVVKALLGVSGIIRLRLSSLESVEVSEELIDIMRQDERLCPHLHLPLQAGDDDILRAMHRHYTTAEYRKLVKGIQVSVPDIAISTDIIVGFPGETDLQFANTMTFVNDLDFARIHVFPYSPRQGTPAATYPGQVPEQEKKRRVHELQVLAEKKAADFKLRFVGREFAVLLEVEKGGLVEGLTGNYIRVYADARGKTPGELVRISLQRSYLDGLWGKIIG